MSTAESHEFPFSWEKEESPELHDRRALVDWYDPSFFNEIKMSTKFKVGDWVVCRFAIGEVANVDEHGRVNNVYFSAHGQPKTIAENHKVYALNRQRLALVEWFSKLHFRLNHVPQGFPLNYEEIDAKLTDMFNTACEDETQSARMQDEGQKFVASICEKVEQLRRIKIGDVKLFKSPS